MNRIISLFPFFNVYFTFVSVLIQLMFLGLSMLLFNVFFFQWEERNELFTDMLQMVQNSERLTPQWNRNMFLIFFVGAVDLIEELMSTDGKHHSTCFNYIQYLRLNIYCCSPLHSSALLGFHSSPQFSVMLSNWGHTYP